MERDKYILSCDFIYLNLLIEHTKIFFIKYSACKQKKGDNNLRLLTLNQALAYETLGKNFSCFINRVWLLGGSDKVFRLNYKDNEAIKHFSRQMLSFYMYMTSSRSAKNWSGALRFQVLLNFARFLEPLQKLAKFQSLLHVNMIQF